MLAWRNIPLLTVGFACTLSSKILAQNNTLDNAPFHQQSTVILIRTFDNFSFDRSYKMYSNFSLLGRIKTHDVIVLNTFDKSVALQATTKAPSLNTDKRTNFQKRKKINYPIPLER